MAVVEVTKDRFEAEVLQSEVPVLADFNAGWCGPCQMLKPVIEELAEEHPDWKFVSINIDDEDELAESFEVSSIPCMIKFKDGNEIDRAVGFRPKDAIAEWLSE